MVRIFDISEAEYYCRSYQGRPGEASKSFRELVNTYRTRHASPFKEGTADFDDYRDCSLRDVERRLFLAVSNYRRSLDLMYTSAAPWAHVTLYYASFFAASALLAMFGCYVADKFIVEVSRSLPGSQELAFNWQIMKTLRIRNKGSHEKFWDIFYECSSSLVPWVTNPTLKTALDPVQGDTAWQIDVRNRVNYDTYQSVDLMAQFQRTFNDHQFPGCLQGELSTQLWTVDNITRLVFSFARQFNLSTDALKILTPLGSRSGKIQGLILSLTPPNLSARLTWGDFV